MDERSVSVLEYYYHNSPESFLKVNFKLKEEFDNLLTAGYLRRFRDDGLELVEITPLGREIVETNKEKRHLQQIQDENIVIQKAMINLQEENLKTQKSLANMQLLIVIVAIVSLFFNIINLCKSN